MTDFNSIVIDGRPSLHDNLELLIQRLESISQERIQTVGDYARGNMDFFADQWQNLRSKNFRAKHVASVVMQRPVTSLFLSLAFMATWFPILLFVVFVTVSFMFTLVGFVFVESSLIGLALVALVIILFLPVCFAGMATVLVLFVNSFFKFCYCIFNRMFIRPLTVFSYYLNGLCQLVLR